MLMQTLAMLMSILPPDPQGSMGLMQLENTLQIIFVLFRVSHMYSRIDRRRVKSLE